VLPVNATNWRGQFFEDDYERINAAVADFVGEDFVEWEARTGGKVYMNEEFGGLVPKTGMRQTRDGDFIAVRLGNHKSERTAFQEYLDKIRDMRENGHIDSVDIEIAGLFDAYLKLKAAAHQELNQRMRDNPAFRRKANSTRVLADGQKEGEKFRQQLEDEVDRDLLHPAVILFISDEPGKDGQTISKLSPEVMKWGREWALDWLIKDTGMVDLVLPSELGKQ